MAVGSYTLSSSLVLNMSHLSYFLISVNLFYFIGFHCLLEGVAKSCKVSQGVPIGSVFDMRIPIEGS